jgi:RNA polymerase sigma-54 factor
MAMGMQLDLSMRLEQKLSPQMIQSLKILQVNALQLEMMIKQEAEINPLLEVDYPEDEEIREEISKEDLTRKENPEAELATPDQNPEVDWEEFIKEGFDLGYRQTENLAQPDPDDNYERPPTYSQSLQDALQDQLKDRRVRDPHLKELVEYLIASLDSNGYLHPSEPDLAQIAQSTNGDELLDVIDDIIEGRLALEMAPEMVREAFHILQSFEPAGIGARNLQECLLIQIYRHEKPMPLAQKIIEECFSLLATRKIPEMAKQLHVSTKEIQEALHQISQLTPKPGRQLGDDQPPSIIPDLVVFEDDHGKLHVRLNNGREPVLRISKAYAGLLENQKTGKEEKKFIKDKLNSANWLIKSIDQRKNTMVRVMETILELQQDFFLKGPEHLKPMILEDVARIVEMHVATISRVTNGKYVDTPQGIFELKGFFSASVKQDDGSEISNTQAKSAIKELIEKEDPAKPLSDQKIADMLNANGMNLARRTVAKYREALNIMPARMRKQF